MTARVLFFISRSSAESAATLIFSAPLGLKLFAPWLDHYGRAISQDLGNALHDLRSVIPHAYHGVGAELGCMLQHQIEGVLAGLFAKLGQQRDVPANQGLKAGANRAEQRTGTDNNAAHDSQAAYDLVDIQFKLGGSHGVGNWH